MGQSTPAWALRGSGQGGDGLCCTVKHATWERNHRPLRFKNQNPSTRKSHATENFRRLRFGSQRCTRSNLCEVRRHTFRCAACCRVPSLLLRCKEGATKRTYYPTANRGLGLARTHFGYHAL